MRVDENIQGATMLPASYFDGVSARAQPVLLRHDGHDLVVTGEGVERRIPARQVQWPERTRHGIRVASFDDGGSVQSADVHAWDAWVHSGGRRDSLVVRLQQSWRWVAASAVLLLLLVAGLQQWGLPLAARGIVAMTPPSVDESIGETSLQVIDAHLMRPSKLAEAEQARLRNAFAQAVGALPPGTVPKWQLVFRQSRIGPNAFALPGGTMVMTDELVELVGRDEQVVTAVLAHELGHVKQRHGVRLLVQTTALGALAGLVVGDFSTVLAGVPVLLGQASYSRKAEHEADEEAVRTLKAAKISPLVMVTLFDRIDAMRATASTGVKAGTGSGRPAKQATDGQESGHGDGHQAPADSWLGIAFASHPSDAERVQFFKDAAGR